MLQRVLTTPSLPPPLSLTCSAIAKVLTVPAPSHLVNSLSQFLTREHGHVTMTRLHDGLPSAVMPDFSRV